MPMIFVLVRVTLPIIPINIILSLIASVPFPGRPAVMLVDSARVLVASLVIVSVLIFVIGMIFVSAMGLVIAMIFISALVFVFGVIFKPAVDSIIAVIFGSTLVLVFDMFLVYTLVLVIDMIFISAPIFMSAVVLVFVTFSSAVHYLPIALIDIHPKLVRRARVPGLVFVIIGTRASCFYHLDFVAV